MFKGVTRDNLEDIAPAAYRVLRRPAFAPPLDFVALYSSFGSAPPATGNLLETPSGPLIAEDIARAYTSLSAGVNCRLKLLYESTIANEGQISAGVLESSIVNLRDNLGILEQIDSGINSDICQDSSADPTTLRTKLRTQAARYRALAWIHGWAILGHLIVHASKPSTDPLSRLGLIAVNAAPSPLSLLLAIYRQIKNTDGTPEPLQHILFSGAHLTFDFGYREEWRPHDNRGEGSTTYYIPQESALIGQSNNQPCPDRGLLSLWGLVNLQLDSWNVLGSSLQNADIILWLKSLQDNKDLDAFDTSSNSTSNAEQFKLRIDKLARFLTFRKKYANTKDLENLVRELSALNIQRDDNDNDPSKVLTDLKIAATPIDAGSGESELLYDAAIWLRYVMMIGYQGTSHVILGKASNSIGALWKKFELPPPDFLSLSPPSSDTSPVRPSATSIPSLRWNSWPASGTISAILNDLILATCSVISFLRNVSDMAKTQFLALTDEGAGQAYAGELSASIDRLRNEIDTTIAKYFDTNTRQARPLTDPGAYFAEPFQRTATASEQARLLGDLSSLYIQSTVDARFYRAISAAYSASELTSSHSPDNLGEVTELSRFNPYSFPKQSFLEYRSDFETAMDALKTVAEHQNATKDLRANFEENERNCKKARELAKAALLACERTVIVSEQAELLTESSKLKEKAADNLVKEKELLIAAEITKTAARKLQLAKDTRLHERAVALVRARIDNCRFVEDIIARAILDLEIEWRQLIDIAVQIETQRNKQQQRQAVLAIVEGIVTIVGVALAWETGSISLAAAGALNNALTTAESLSDADWSRLGTVIQAIGGTGRLVGEAANFEKKEPYSKGNTNSEASSFGKVMGAVNDVVPAVGNIIDAGQALEDARTTIGQPTFSVDDSGSSPSEDRETRQVAFDGPSIRIDLGIPKLQKAIGAILDSGGTISHDIEVWRDFVFRVSQPVPNLSAELQRYVRKSVRPISSPELVTALENLTATIASLGDGSISVLKDVFVNAMIFVREGETVLAIPDREIDSAIKGLNDELETYQKDIEQEALTGICKRIYRMSKDINNEVAGLIKEGDDQGLVAYANREIPDAQDEVRAGLKEVKRALMKARMALEERSYDRLRASMNLEAAELFAEAGQIAGQRATVRAQAAKLDRLSAEMMQKEQLTERQRKDHQVSAALADKELAISSMLRAYWRCLEAGFDPLDSPETASRLDKVGILSFWGILAGRTFPSPQVSEDGVQLVSGDVSQCQLEALADSVKGMIRWMSLLRLGLAKKELAQLYLKTEEALYRRDKNKLREMGDSIGRLSKDVGKSDVLTISILPFSGHTGFEAGPSVVWLDQAVDRENWLQPLRSRGLSLEAEAVVAVARSWFTPDGLQKGRPNVAVPFDKTRASYYMLVDDIYVTYKWKGDERFLSGVQLFVGLLAPEEPLSDAFDLASRVSVKRANESGWSRKQAFTDVEVRNFIESRKGRLELARQLMNLSGAIGEWTFFLLCDMGEGSINALRENLVVTINLVYLSVSHKDVN